MARLLCGVLLLCWVGRPAPVAACACIGLGPQDHFDRAELVFVGRAARARRQGDRLLQPVHVLQALKGRPGKQVVLSREAKALNTCERSFEEDEVALVFLTKGRAGICAGNYALEVQMERLDEYLKLAGAAEGGVTLPVLEAALGPALDGVPRRGPLAVAFAPLVGQRSATLRLVSGSERAAVLIHGALAHGPMHLLSGAHLGRRRLFTSLVLAVPGRPPEVLHTLRRDGCRRTDGCRYHGHCSFDRRRGVCQARGADCRRSSACSDQGRCTARRGACVVGSDEDCRRSERCKTSGHCHEVGGHCRATTAADCHRSETCGEFGDCSATGGACAPGGAKDCVQSSVACKMNGRCSFRQGQCIVGTDDDCRRADACKVHGRCRARKGQCVR